MVLCMPALTPGKCTRSIRPPEISFGAFRAGERSSMDPRSWMAFSIGDQVTGGSHPESQTTKYSLFIWLARTRETSTLTMDTIIRTIMALQTDDHQPSFRKRS